MKRILVVDNHDSFVYNIVEYLRQSVDVEVLVVLNDSLTDTLLGTIDGIVLSPGAGLPIDYPQMHHLLMGYHRTVPILGICLGHQAIATFFGAQLKRFKQPRHGHCSHLQILDPNDVLWKNICTNCAIGRYHSWTIDTQCIPDTLHVTGLDEEGNIMSIKHVSYPIWGLQFHPESIITESGRTIINNWLSILQPDKKKIET